MRASRPRSITAAGLAIVIVLGGCGAGSQRVVVDPLDEEFTNWLGLAVAA